MMIWGGLTCLSACLVKPTLVSITPDFGYVDGCIDVTIQGHNLGEKATGDVGGVALTNIKPATVDDSRPDWAQDVGYLFTATVPKAPGGKSGFYDLNLKADGADLNLPLGFFYRDCPASFIVDSVSLPNSAITTTTSGATTLTPTTGVAVGDQIGFVGCGLDPDHVKIEYHKLVYNYHYGDTSDTAVPTAGPSTSDTASTITTTTTTDPTVVEYGDLVDDCSTARAHTVVPATLPAGADQGWIRPDDGTLYAPDSPLCPARAGHATPTFTTSVYSYPVTWVGDSPSICAPIYVTVGGAR